MPPKGTNGKKESGRAKKLENKNKEIESANVNKERIDAEEWAHGTKVNKSQEKEEKRRAEADRKAENARLLAEEEAALPKVKGIKKPNVKKTPKSQGPAGPGAIAAAGGLTNVVKPVAKAEGNEDDKIVESFQATGIDDALDLLAVVTAKSDKASVGQQAAGLERHPERRFKAAYEAYQERELPVAKQEHPGLRLQQYKDLLYKQFQKSPENPFNQSTVAYDASKVEQVEALQKKKQLVEQRLREK